MAEPKLSDTQPLGPAPAFLQIRLQGKVRKVPYEQVFALACSLLEQRQFEDAAKLFQKLEQFRDRGPRASIMRAFCEAAALHFDTCSKPLATAFEGDKSAIVSDLHNAFISFHVGIRQDALQVMAELVNRRRDLPTLCLLLGYMLHAGGESAMAEKCWSMAVRRDRPGGAVAYVASRHLQHNRKTA
jgi:hypothetical protein